MLYCINTVCRYMGVTFQCVKEKNIVDLCFFNSCKRQKNAPRKVRLAYSEGLGLTY